MPPGHRALGAVALLALVLPHLGAYASDCENERRFVDYLHIEANEGGSSGGHAALRVGETVYHWQNEGDGLLRLSRRDPEDFLYEYAILENRPLHLSRVAVSPDTEARLRDAFQRRWLDESVAVEGLAARRADRALLDAWLGAVDGSPRGAGVAPRVSLQVPAAGLFATGVTVRGEPALEALRERVERRSGADFVDRRAAVLRHELAAALEAWLEEAGSRRGRSALEVSGGARWRPETSPARDVVDRAAALTALRVLREVRPLAPAGHHAPASEALRLSDEERAALAAWAARLEDELVALLGSDRPGAGPALLVGMARLAALRQSVDSGRLVVVDAYPADPAVVAGARLERYRPLLPQVLAEAYDDLRRERDRFVARPGAGERDWVGVETAANRVVELERAVAGGGALRVAPAPFVPSRPAAVAIPVPVAAGATLAAAREHALDRERRWQAEVERRFGYRLITRNCVTEIFRVVDAALGPLDLQADAPREVAGPIGARVDPGEDFQFIPFVSAAAVRRGWRVVEQREIPSLAERLAARDGGGLLTALRESSPLTSRMRGHSRRDSLFAFFTEDLAALRPALGAVNLATGLGGAALGLLLAPFDQADTLVAGLRGALFSLPELGFVSIRKGAFEWVPPEQRPLDLGRELAPSAQACGEARLAPRAASLTGASPAA